MSAEIDRINSTAAIVDNTNTGQTQMQPISWLSHCYSFRLQQHQGSISHLDGILFQNKTSLKLCALLLLAGRRSYIYYDVRTYENLLCV